jgi:hydroxymethyl cephem carbamoyltransferase
MTRSVCDMSVLAFKPGHDGGVAHISGDALSFSVESEKDNGTRFSELTIDSVLRALELCRRPPDVIAQSGWSVGRSPLGPPIGAGYLGLQSPDVRTIRLFGQPIHLFSSTHERSHILCAYGLSPFCQGQPCYVLVWEGHIGAFYFVDSDVRVTKLCDVLSDPGIRYAFAFALADPTFQLRRGAIRLSDAGKLMAICGYSSAGHIPPEADGLIESLLDRGVAGGELCKDDFRSSIYYNCGVTSQLFANFAQRMSNALFRKFEAAARRHVIERHPLLISGGCGLNCDWNLRWKETGIFSDVFVPPCSNDSGAAIGTAIDAMLYFTGRAKVRWSVYSGESAIRDGMASDEFLGQPFDPVFVSDALARGNVIGWVRGRYEIGPRALGARSILGSPTDIGMLRRLNAIKRREDYRPIAPICLEDDMHIHFEPGGPSPYMLEFRKVISDRIPAVTHVDRSARPQSVSPEQNRALHELLTHFKRRTGVGVLCNTSLNFNGSGFINRMSDLSRYADINGLDGFVFEDEFFLRKGRIV